MVIRVILTLTLLLVAAGNAVAVNWPIAPKLNAKSWVLLDARSGQVVTANDEHQRLAPASLTKMMTLYVAFSDLKLGRLPLDETVKVSEKAWKIGGSTMFLDPRMHPTVEELLHGIATLSGNDACIALAEYVAGSEEAFAMLMNNAAERLGMKDSHFVNSTGFPHDNHYSSAYDMALLGAALWREFPEQYKVFSEKDYTFANHTQPNRNRLLWRDERVDGIKTGHTEEAGYCLVGSAEENQTRFVSAVFGTESMDARETQSEILLNYGFRNFATVRPAEQDIRREVEVFEGDENSVWLRPAQPVWITVPKGYEAKVGFRLRYESPVKAPLHQAQHLGIIEAFIKDGESSELLTSIPMQTASAVARASWFGRKIDGIRLWLRDAPEETAQP